MRYTFGTVCVDTGTRSVSRPGGPVHLTRKAFDLLLLLLEARPNAVSKDAIYARLWPDTFVSDSSLQTLIHEIRFAIDNPGAQESWIRTVHAVGYRFDGDVLSDAGPRATPLEATAGWLVGESMRVPLRIGENILGRGLPDVTEIDLPTISRHHARIVATEGRITVEDLGSKNGTWLKSERIADLRALTDGDVVHLGSARFTLRIARSTEATESTDNLPRATDALDDLRKNSG